MQCILRDGQQAGFYDYSSIFRFCEGLSQNKAIPAKVRALAIQRLCSAGPLRGTDIRNKVIDWSCQRGLPHPDEQREWTVRSRCGSEDLILVIADLPIALISPFYSRCGEFHTQFNCLAGSYFGRKRHEVLPAHPITADQYSAISCLPGARAYILQPPNLGKRSARCKNGITRHSNISNELDTVTTAVGSWCARDWSRSCPCGSTRGCTVWCKGKGRCVRGSQCCCWCLRPRPCRGRHSCSSRCTRSSLRPRLSGGRQSRSS